MGPRRRRIAIVTACALALGLTPAAARAQGGDQARYALAKGCYALAAGDRLAARDGAGGYALSAAAGAAAEPFRMQPTELGRYLLYGRGGVFLSSSGDAVTGSTEPSPQADWRVDVAGDAFTLSLPANGRSLAVRDGRLVLADRPSPLRFVAVEGCETYPEVELDASGTPSRGESPWGQVRGLLDAHMHMMAFEFLGGRAHCGRPWHRYGAPFALVDCPDHYPADGAAAVLENAISTGGGRPPVRTHDPVGWPTFADWPAWYSLTHEQAYHRWLERAWMGGLRIFVNLLVDNEVLCSIYPYRQNSCNEMDGVRLQARRIRELEDYIDAQWGGPGRGWFRIVTDPFEARRVINEGKLAVVLGIEVSKLFDCGVYNDQPQCDRAQIDRQLEEVHRLGVRQMELVNKFDNALAGVAGDSGTTGVLTNAGNKLATGKFLQMQACEGHAHDRTQAGVHHHNTDILIANGIQAFVPPGTLPIYPSPPHCNARGLTDLGEHLVRRMIDKGMIVDPDHLSVLARNQLLNVVEAENHPGIVSSHSWSTADAFPRIYALGGVITPYAGDSTGFVEAWRATKPLRTGGWYWGFGYGADMNGFGAQGPPRPGAAASNPVRYPFTSFDGAVTLDRQRSGSRVFDINVDGVAHYGLYPDWIEDLRMLAGDEIVEDMARGAEAYLQMWERAEGVPRSTCRPARTRMARRGIGAVTYGRTAEQLLRTAGQPVERGPRAWTYCVRRRDGRDGEIVATLDERGRVALVGSRIPEHRAFGIGRGDRASRLKGRARRFGRRDVRIRSNKGGGYFVYGVRRGRVRWTATVSGLVGRSAPRLRRHLRFAGLR